MIKGFTAQELEELAAFDAEVGADDELTPEEFNFAREMDKTAMRNRLDKQTAHRKSVSAAYQRAYREQNREEIAAKQRGALLRSVRKARKESQKTFAVRFRVSQPTLSLWETGAVPIPEYVMDRVKGELSHEA